MANLVGCAAMSHAPQLMLNPDNWHLLNNRPGRTPARQSRAWRKKLRKSNGPSGTAAWKRSASCAKRSQRFNPDVLVVVGDDQHENLVDDNMPPFTIFMGEEVEASLSLRYLNQPKSENRTKYRVDAKIAEGLVNGFMEEGFDPSYSKKTRYDGGLGHAFARVLKFVSPQAKHAVVPVMVNTYYPPAPSAQRCVQLRPRAGERFAPNSRDRARCHRRFRRTQPHQDRRRIWMHGFIQALQAKRSRITWRRCRAADLVEGTSEIRNWIVTAAAADRRGNHRRLFSALSHHHRRRLRHGFCLLGTSS